MEAPPYATRLDPAIAAVPAFTPSFVNVTKTGKNRSAPPAAVAAETAGTFSAAFATTATSESPKPVDTPKNPVWPKIAAAIKPMNKEGSDNDGDEEEVGSFVLSFGDDEGEAEVEAPSKAAATSHVYGGAHASSLAAAPMSFAQIAGAAPASPTPEKLRPAAQPAAVTSPAAAYSASKPSTPKSLSPTARPFTFAFEAMEISPSKKATSPPTTAAALRAAASPQTSPPSRCSALSARSDNQPGGAAGVPLNGEAEVIRNTQRLLNELSLKKFNRLSNEFISLQFTSHSMLNAAVNLVLEKAQMEQDYGTMCANLCVKLANTQYAALGDDNPSKPQAFKKALLRKAQVQLTSINLRLF